MNLLRMCPCNYEEDDLQESKNQNDEKRLKNSINFKGDIDRTALEVGISENESSELKTPELKMKVNYDS